MLTTVAALSRNRVIGKDGQVPWRLPGDLKHFRETTRGGVVVMGRTTFESIGKPLPQRENWVLTRDPNWKHPQVRVFHDLAELLRAASGHEEVWVIGGEQIYRQLLPHCQRQWLTEVQAEVEGDTFYPEFSERDWQLKEKRPGPDDGSWPYHFCLYVRI